MKGPFLHLFFILDDSTIQDQWNENETPQPNASLIIKSRAFKERASFFSHKK